MEDQTTKTQKPTNCSYTRYTGSNVHPTEQDQPPDSGPWYHGHMHTHPYNHTHTNSNYHTP